MESEAFFHVWDPTWNGLPGLVSVTVLVSLEPIDELDQFFETISERLLLIRLTPAAQRMLAGQDLVGPGQKLRHLQLNLAVDQRCRLQLEGNLRFSLLLPPKLLQVLS